MEAACRERHSDERTISELRSNRPPREHAHAQAGLHELDDRLRELHARKRTRLDTGWPKHLAQHRALTAVDRVEDQMLVAQVFRLDELPRRERVVRRDDDHLLVLEQRGAAESSLIDIAGDDCEIE